MLYLDIALRGASIAMLALLAILLLRARIGWEGRLSVVAIAVSKSAFLILNSVIAADLPAVALANLTLLASLTPNAVTWLIVTIFIDPPGRRWPWFFASSIVSASLYAHFLWPEQTLICLPLSVALYSALLGLALWSARGDLVECRCRARPGFAVAIAGLALFLTGAQAFGFLTSDSPLLNLMQAGGVFAVSLAFAIWILTVDNALWPGGAEEPPGPARPPLPDPGADAAIISRLTHAMEDGIWREEGLTIGALASRLSVPEHRLRRAINSGLGHRNFSSFINRQRILAARAALEDPEACGKTILEIAYSVGFASLGPFNRAFRAETGQSPTEYRRAAFDAGSGADPLADSEKGTPIPANLH